MTENVVVRSSEWSEKDLELLFDNEEVHFTDRDDIPGLLKELGVYASTSQARKAGRTGDIPSGWTHEFKASKKRRLWIWNPVE